MLVIVLSHFQLFKGTKVLNVRLVTMLSSSQITTNINKNNMYTDPTIVDGPNFSDSKLLPMIPITARRISGAEEPVQRVHMILEIAYVIYCKAILNNDMASRGGKEPV